MRRDDTIAALATAPGIGAIAIVRLSGPDGARDRSRADGARTAAALRRACGRFATRAAQRSIEASCCFFPRRARSPARTSSSCTATAGASSATRVLARRVSRSARAPPKPASSRCARSSTTSSICCRPRPSRTSSRAAPRSGARRVALARRRVLDGRRRSSSTRSRSCACGSRRGSIFPTRSCRSTRRPNARPSSTRCVARLDDARGAGALGPCAARRLQRRDRGPPNAGKSSLLNRLAGYDAAIVTEIPGTTRDPLREHLTLDGLPVTVVDTAGLRETNDPVEREGVRRARLEVARADRVLWVADAREPLAATLAAARGRARRRRPLTIVAQQDRPRRRGAAAREASTATSRSFTCRR